jgi:hypothetical protein
LVVPTFHWYDGVEPPLVAVAVKVTEVPAQIVVVGVEMVTDGADDAVTVMVIAFEVAVVGDAHDAVEVMTHVTTCPLVSVLVVYVGLFVPTLVVPTFHW